MRPRRCVETGQTYLQAYRSMASPCSIWNETGGKRICCRLRSHNANAEQEGPKLIGIGRLLMEKCNLMRRQRYMSLNWIYSWRLSSSKIRQQYSRLEHSAKITNIRMSGPLSVTTPHIYDKEIQCRTRNYVPLVVPGLATGSSSSTSPTSPTTLSKYTVKSTKRPATIRSESMREREREYRETCRLNQPKTQKQKKLRNWDSTGRPVIWIAWVVTRIHGESGGWTNPRI